MLDEVDLETRIYLWFNGPNSKIVSDKLHNKYAFRVQAWTQIVQITKSCLYCLHSFCMKENSEHLMYLPITR